MNPRPMVWSVRREVWENRSIYIAPLAVAAVIVFGALMATMFARTVTLHLHGSPEKLAQPYNFAAVAIMAATFIVAFFYCVDALYGERRDRSILFWKSMPVSDVTTVLSKAAIPLLILPLVTFVVTIVAQLIMLLLSTAYLTMSGHSAAELWTTLPWFQMSGMLLYHLITVHSLYYAPIFGWLFLISAWARRAPFVWAVLPPVAISVVERMIFNTSYFANMLGSRISGGEEMKGAPRGVLMLGSFNPGEFLSKPGLWVGLAFCIAFLAAAVRLRRYRDPI